VEAKHHEKLAAESERHQLEAKLKGVLDQFKAAINKIEEMEEKYAIRSSNKKHAAGMNEAKKLINSYMHEMQCMELRLYGKMQLERRSICEGGAGHKVQ